MLYERIVDRLPIDKGWSGDIKYRAVTENGQRYLLRITPSERAAHREMMVTMQQAVANRGVPMCEPLEFGNCAEGFYLIQRYIDGSDLEEILPTLTEERQYAYGVEAGQILAKVHTIPAPSDQADWEQRFNAKIDRKIHMYLECPLKYENGDALIAYLQANRYLLKDRPQCYQHGDYHVGNMMLEHKEKLTIIDFDRYDFGDPWEEFNRIVWCAQLSPSFASGMVDGYFNSAVPENFWQLLALYIASNTLSSLPWAIPFGQQEIDTMTKQAAEVLDWYDGMKKTIPGWYRGKGQI